MLDEGGYVHIRYITSSPLVDVGCFNPPPLGTQRPRRHTLSTRHSGSNTKLSYLEIGSAVARYCPLWGPLFALTILFLITHEQLLSGSPFLGLLWPQLA
ncbi:unnamed protein product [Prunus armeniaca]